MFTLVLIRHGESLSNQHKILKQPKTLLKKDEEDILTSKGCIQAELTGKALKLFLQKRSFKLYSSTLTRAKMTAEIIKNQINPLIQVEHNERLIEKMSEESYEEVFRRFNDFCVNILSLSKDNKEEFILIVTHGNLIKSIIVNSLELHHNYQLIGGVNNCGISIFIDRKIIAYNMIIHLA